MKMSIFIFTSSLVLYMLDCTYAVRFVLDRYEIDRSINETGRYLGHLSSGQPYICHYAQESKGQSSLCIEQNLNNRDEFEKENNLYPFFFPDVGVSPKCPPLNLFKNGKWKCQDNLRHDLVTVYTSCYPVCNPNFTIEMDFQVRCTEFREWDKLLEPHCISTTLNKTGTPMNTGVTTRSDSTQYPVTPDLGTESTTFSTKSVTSTPVQTSTAFTNVSHPRLHHNNDSDDDLDAVPYVVAAIVIVLGILSVGTVCYFCRRTKSHKCCLSCKIRSYDPEISQSYTASALSSNLCEAKSPLIQSEESPAKPADSLEDQTNNNGKDSQIGTTTVVHCSSEIKCGNHQLPTEAHQNGINTLGPPEHGNVEDSMSNNNDVPSSGEENKMDNPYDETAPEFSLEEDNMWENIKKGPESCNCSVNDALNDISRLDDSVLFVENLGDLIDPDCHYGNKKSWVGLATALLALSHNKIIRLRHQSKEYLKELLIHFQSNGIRLGHILEYFTRKDSLRIDVVKHFEKHHKNCDYCDSLYLCINDKQLQRLHR